IQVARVEGRVMGLTFFAFQNDVSLSVPPGRAVTLKYRMRLLGIRSQAVGLIPAQLELVDSHNHVVASERFTADVRGTLFSVYGIFGIAVIVFTVMTLVGAILALRRGKLSP